MNRSTLTALIVLNLALVAAVVMSSLPSTALAQGRGRSDYLMVAGQTRARNNQQLIYLIETRSGKLISFYFNTTNNRVEMGDRRVMTNDVAAVLGAPNR